MPSMKTGIVLGLLVSSAIAIAGCGSGPATPTTSPSTQPPAAAPSVATASPPNEAAGPVVNVTIAAGVVTPTNSEVEAAVGQPIVLEVSSDAADTIHVHSVPERVFDVKPLPGQRFEFAVGIPGRVDVELHNLNRTVVTIVVMP